jgi:hypothetical protein
VSGVVRWITRRNISVSIIIIIIIFKDDSVGKEFEKDQGETSVDGRRGRASDDGGV